MYKNNIKRIVSISAAAMMVLSALKIAPASELATLYAADEMTAFEITENMKIGWNLGNTLDATVSKKDPDTKKDVYVDFAGVESETAWGNPKASKELIDAVKAKGFNTVRVPTTWFQHLLEDGTIDPDWMARVHEVVDYAIDNDMYVILNLHHENWVNRADLGTAYDDMHEKLINLWTQINASFGDYDQHLIFECMNEPRAQGTTHEWWGPEESEVETINKLNADFVNLIRSSDSPYAKNRLLMIPGYCAGSDVSMISLIDVPKDDDFVAVSIHAYVPYNFTMNPATDLEDRMTFSSSWSTELAGILDGFRSTFLDKDIPVVVGEFGTSNYGNTDARIAWATQYLTTAKKYGFPCVLWDNNVEVEAKPTGEAHGYINRKTLEWYSESEKVVDTMMSVINDDSIVWGSERHLPEFKHQDLSEGTPFIDEAIEIDASKSKTYENTTPGKDITWKELEGKEVAIKFTGTTPLLSFSDASYGNWTELKPYVVDDENGIAYYLVSDQLPSAWGQDMDTLAHMQSRTEKVTQIESITILDAPDTSSIEVPVDKTKKKKISFADADRDGNIVITIKGEPDTSTNGCVGFMNGDDWDQVEWKGKTDADGKLTVTIPMSDIPAAVENAEVQIWLNPEALDFESVEFTSAEAPTEVTPEPTTENIPDTTPGTVTKYGDANCDSKINVSDAVSVLQYVANKSKYPLDAEGLANADCDGETGITGGDALAIQQADAGLVSLPLAK
ncbi:MAG TPA: endoglucanase [Ruminococcus sp.]|nr:endoglucanase [Ruminococcus sp.]